MSSALEETAAFALAGVAVIVASFAYKLIDASSGTRLCWVPINLNNEIRQKE